MAFFGLGKKKDYDNDAFDELTEEEEKIVEELKQNKIEQERIRKEKELAQQKEREERRKIEEEKELANLKRKIEGAKPETLVAELSTILLNERIKRRLNVKDFKDLLKISEEEYNSLQDFKYSPDIFKLSEITETLGITIPMVFGSGLSEEEKGRILEVKVEE